MKPKLLHKAYLCVITIVVMTMYACTYMGNREMRENIDIFNNCAYKFYYTSIDSVEKYAIMALALEGGRASYKDGRDEAACHLGFAKYMRMDYDSAHFYFRQVIDKSSNELYRFIADVMMMRVCQRRSENKLFYDYHNDALEKMNRIMPETATMTFHQRKLWNFALSDYHMALFTYYYYLRQEEDAQKELDYLANNHNLFSDDPAQAALYYFLLGNARNVDDRLTEDNAENLLEAASIARTHDLPYILAKSLTSLAEDIVGGNDYRPSKINMLKELIAFPDTLPESELPLQACRYALQKFIDYGSLFDVAQTYNAMAEYYLSINRPDTALLMMEQALDCVNRHHRTVSDDGLNLYIFEQTQDSISTEKRWIDSGVVCLPEWMADIREHLSIVFSALGRKQESDYNWNIYLDIFETTRQDKKMEQLHSTLENERDHLNRLLILGGLAVILIAAAIFYLTSRIRENYRQNYLKEQKAVEEAMRKWRQKTDEDFTNLEEHHEMAMSERFSKELRLEEQKRQYINKSTCLAIVHSITPFLDRTVNEVRKIKILSGQDTPLSTQNQKVISEKLQYVSELIEQINIYNDILTQWINIRQGEVALNIENFPLQPLFDIMQKNNCMFLSKSISLNVEPSEVVVKADRALTLFMINTLLENARKYTGEGGEVGLYANVQDTFVEISVRDNGAGLSQADIDTILGEKVYDSAKIGDVEHDGQLRENKGFGFGLLNCKGIIDKYRKSNALFQVCTFGIESEKGKGSRFFFTLPKGTIRNLCLACCLFLPTVFTSCTHHEEYVDPINQLLNVPQDDPRILHANYYADMAKLSNEEQLYDLTLLYADSAIQQLNEYYLEKNPDGQDLMKLYDQTEMAEIEWVEQGFPTEYYAIMQMRNEVAIAALGLYQTQLYYYNNYIFSRLYKLTSRNQDLGRSCADIKEANDNRKTFLFVLLASIIVGAVIYYSIYYKNNILPTFSLRQILELNRRIFNNQEEQRLATIIHQGINDIRRTSGVALYLTDGRLLFSDGCPQQEYLSSILKDACGKQEVIMLDRGKTRIYPLNTDNGTCVGMIAYILYSENVRKNDDNMLRMISQYTAENIYYSTVRMEKLSADIETIEDDRRRAEREGNIVHVQNMVIDNTLSTIKHETMYYPNRIRQIVDHLRQTELADEKELTENVNTMSELTEYYKEIFTILSDCASRQIHRPMFKRSVVSLREAAGAVARYHRKYKAKTSCEISLNIHDNPDCSADNTFVIADRTMLFYLIENVVEAIFKEKKPGTLALDFEMSEDFIKFAFSFDNLAWTTDTFNNLFYPQALSYNTQTGELTGAQMLIAKQIIREHDEHVRRGCRIMAMPATDDGTGICLSFTIPIAKNYTNANQQ